MFGLLFRVFLIALVVYLIIGLVLGGYTQILSFYYWMRP